MAWKNIRLDSLIVSVAPFGGPIGVFNSQAASSRPIRSFLCSNNTERQKSGSSPSKSVFSTYAFDLVS